MAVAAPEHDEQESPEVLVEEDNSPEVRKDLAFPKKQGSHPDVIEATSADQLASVPENSDELQISGIDNSY